MGGDTSQHYWCLARTRTCVHTHTHTHVRTPLRPEAPRGGRGLGHAAGRPSRRSSVTPRTTPRLAARASPGPGTPTPRPTWLAPHTLTSTHRPPPQVPSLPAAFGAGRPAPPWSGRAASQHLPSWSTVSIAVDVLGLSQPGQCKALRAQSSPLIRSFSAVQSALRAPHLFVFPPNE